MTDSIENIIKNAAEYMPEAQANARVDDEKPLRESQTSAIVSFCCAHNILFHDANREVYARAKSTGETRRLSSNNFKDWVTSKFYMDTGKAVRDQAFREAITTLSGIARHQGECHEVHIRVAGKDGVYYLDLAQTDNSRAVRISSKGWDIVEKPDAYFIRPETMRSLPVPVRGGNINKLWDIANIPKNARLLVLAWIAECFRPDTPSPVIEFIGEQGTAKSTTQKAIRGLTDPNACDLRSMAKTPDDIFIAAGANWIVSYENVSHLSAPMQDALCVIATGGGHATRKLYTNSEEAVISVKRSVMINGIAATVTAQDLVDRAVSVELPSLSTREESTVLWREYEAEKPKILGALLDLTVTALQRLPYIHIPQHQRPRMIEFARFGMAIAEATGKKGSDFLEQFTASRGDALERTLDASPVATAIREWIKEHPQGKEDTAKGFMKAMDGFKPPHGEGWPRTPKGFADAMRRAASALRQLGIECHSQGKQGGEIRWWIGKAAQQRKDDSACPAGTPSPASMPETGHAGHSGHEVQPFLSPATEMIEEVA